MRKGEWKLLKNPIDPAQDTPMDEKDALFLSNIQIHPEELENLAREYPEKVSELLQAYQEWYDRVK
ncbi:MAG: hypothetical protein P1P82_12120 [Bacteroidales bacterium]|nr:hypothetical protein [Bacteroidales bacterium]MDT8432967.1 hypothetical protein [Bacteroidales bacterium]